MTVLADGGISGGAVGFVVVVALVIGAVFLFRSMLRHLRKVPPTFEEPPPGAPPAPDNAAPHDPARDKRGAAGADRPAPGQSSED